MAETNIVISAPSNQSEEQNAVSMPVISRRYNSSQQWLSECRKKQSKKMTPELRARLKKQAKRQRHIGKRKKRAQVYQRAGLISKNAWAQGNLRVARSAESSYAASASKSAMQLQSVQNVYRSHDAWENEEDDQAEEQLSRALDLVQIEQNADEVQVNDNNAMSSVLNQLRREPTNDAELAAKFQLYETFLQTVIDSRKATYDFWKDCKADFAAAAGNVVTQVEKDLKDIDSQDNLGIVFHEHRWYVYDMTVQADKNNEMIKGVLKKIETKLELLGKDDDDCPFCLEPLNEVGNVVTLGCCHKTCKECWDNWQEIRGRAAFCPLCRQDEFLNDVMSM